MSADRLQMAIRGLVVAILVVLPVVFWRGVDEAFDLTKATALWILGLFLVGAVSLYLSPVRHRELLKWPLLAAGTFFVAAVVTTLTSVSPITSLLGQYSRYTGLVTVVICLFLYLGTAIAYEQESLRRLAGVCSVASAPVFAYGFLQLIGHDPFKWGSDSFTAFRMSTLGNPNHAAAYTAIVLPLIVLTMMRNEAPSWVRVSGGTLFGLATASLSTFESFQGPVAALSTVGLLVLLARWSGARLGGWIVAGILSGLVVVLPVLPASGWLVAIGATVGGVVLALEPRLRDVAAPSRVVRNKRTALTAAGLVVVALLAAGWSKMSRYVEQGLQGGFVERGDFYRAAVSIFRADPLVGSGLETYGIRFTQVRPASHAIAHEASISSSAHSIPLGMFSNGGLLLGSAYLFLVALTAATLLKCIRSMPPKERTVLAAFGAAWLAYQIQSLVSVENVTTYAFHFVLSGAVMAVARAQQLAALRAPGKNAGPRMRAIRYGWPIVGAVGALCVVLSVSLVIRPLRAAQAAQEGLVAILKYQDPEGGRRGFEDARDLAPWDARYRLRLAEWYKAAGQPEQVIENVKAAVERVNRSPVLLAAAADLASKAGDDALSLLYMEDAVSFDPHAPTLRQRAATRYVEAGRNAASLGDPALARQRYERALELVPGFTDAEQALASL